MFMYAIIFHDRAEAITTTETEARVWVVKFLDKYGYVLDRMSRFSNDSPIIVRAHAKEIQEITIELRICKTEVVTP